LGDFPHPKYTPPQSTPYCTAPTDCTVLVKVKRGNVIFNFLSTLFNNASSVALQFCYVSSEDAGIDPRGRILDEIQAKPPCCSQSPLELCFEMYISDFGFCSVTVHCTGERRKT
jgi:hypothetical protein